MVRTFAPFVNYPINYITIFKGLMRFSNLGGKSEHPQINEVRLGGVGNEIQMDPIAIDGRRMGGRIDIAFILSRTVIHHHLQGVQHSQIHEMTT